MKRKSFAILLAFSLLTSCLLEAKGKTPVLNKKSIRIALGKKYRLKVKNAAGKKVKWSSSNKKIVTVKNGRITAKKVGSAKIRAKVAKKTLVCKVIVKKSGKTVTQSTGTQNSNSSRNTTTKATAKPSATPTPGSPSNSLINAPTADPNTRDDGWIPGWY